MVRILYGVAGEGMGHAIRSSVVIEHLIEKGDDVLIVASRMAFPFLSKYFKNVHEIHGLHFVYDNNMVQNLKTLFQNVDKLPKGAYYTFRKLFKLVYAFKPQIIISDFEPFSNLVCKLFKIPLISIDNIHVLTQCKGFNIPKHYIRDMTIASIVTRLIVSRAKFYLITTFFYPEIKDRKKTFLFPPILREKIIKLKPKKRDYILVYQTSKSYEGLLTLLKKIDQKFVVYGFDKQGTDKNIVFEKFNECTFFKDLASCKAVIANGGFGLVSEAIHLGKPVLSIPVGKQFEQILNAIYLQRLGYGEFHTHLIKTILKNFILNSSLYEKNLRRYKREDNSKILNKLDFLIEKLTK